MNTYNIQKNALTALVLLTAVTTIAIPRLASAQLFINEIFFNPGGGVRDDRDEYIEIRGPAGFSLENYYLVFVEGDDDAAGLGSAGLIDNVFDLNYNAANPSLGQSIGSNGFLTLRQKGSLYNVATETTDLVNSGTGVGFGTGIGSSSIGANDVSVDFPGSLENAASTAMLIRKIGNLVPAPNYDIDIGNDGLDTSEDPDHWSNSWEIVDAIGYSASQEIEDSEFARLYANVNFFADFAGAPLPPGWVPRIEPDAEHEVLLYEFEYVGRWGNSTGQTADDWHVSNFTDNPGSGYINTSFLLRQSGDPHPGNDGNPNTPPPQPPTVETNQEVPYGTILTGTLGAPNYLKGDYNKNGEVDAADYVVWRNSVGQTGSEYPTGPPATPLLSNHHPADGDHSFLVDEADYPIWKAQFGKPTSNGSLEASALANPSGLSSVPEPASLMLATIGLLGAAIRRQRRQY